MKLKYNNEIFTLDGSFGEDNLIKANINNELIEIAAKKLDNNTYSSNFNNKKLNVSVWSNQLFVFVNLDGHTFKFDRIDEDFGADGASGANLSVEEIKPPMPGSIVKVLVSVGDEVAESDALVIIEAMKMETTLYSSISGKITAVNCSEKEQVDTDRVLIVVDAENK